MPEQEETKKGKGRIFRAYVGFAVIGVSLIVFGIDHLFYKKPFALIELSGHALFMGLGLLLIDINIFKEFVKGVKDLIGRK